MAGQAEAQRKKVVVYKMVTVTGFVGYTSPCLNWVLSTHPA